MSRKELYKKVKELNAADAIMKRFGDNFTRISNAKLEDFLKNFGKKKAAPKNKKNVEDKVVIVKLLSILQAKKVLTAKEAEEVASLL